MRARTNQSGHRHGSRKELTEIGTAALACGDDGNPTADHVRSSLTHTDRTPNRDYSTSLGRWIQQDPAGYIDGANTYPLVRNDPLALSDPYGLASALTVGTTYESELPTKTKIGTWQFRYRPGEHPAGKGVGDMIGTAARVSFYPSTPPCHCKDIEIVQLVQVIADGKVKTKEILGYDWAEPNGWAVDQHPDSVSPIYNRNSQGQMNDPKEEPAANTGVAGSYASIRDIPSVKPDDPRASDYLELCRSRDLPRWRRQRDNLRSGCVVDDRRSWSVFVKSNRRQGQADSTRGSGKHQ